VDLNHKAAAGLALADAKKVDGAAIFAYGNFITVAINFLLLAFVIFLMVKSIMKLKRKEEAAPAAPEAPSKEEVLLQEIRDAIRAK
jgi:large conductance mechanosensitive channel